MNVSMPLSINLKDWSLQVKDRKAHLDTKSPQCVVRSVSAVPRLRSLFSAGVGPLNSSACAKSCGPHTCSVCSCVQQKLDKLVLSQLRLVGICDKYVEPPRARMFFNHCRDRPRRRLRGSSCTQARSEGGTLLVLLLALLPPFGGSTVASSSTPAPLPCSMECSTMSIACEVDATHCRESVNADKDGMLMKRWATCKRDRHLLQRCDLSSMRVHRQ